MHVMFRGVRIELKITGTSEVQNINGSKEIHLHIEPVIPPGPRGPGEPIELPRAA
jgi:hypothetical protein